MNPHGRMIIYRVLRTRWYIWIPPQNIYESVCTENILNQKKERSMESISISSPLHEKRLMLLLVKKQQIGRRAYSDITKVKPSSRKEVLYEKQKSNKTLKVY